MLDYAHLEALLAVEREKSFEGAARALGVTSSAISQRIKLLEERIGAVALNRQTPVSTTDVGAQLCRHAEMVLMLEEDVVQRNRKELGYFDEGFRKIKIAVNDDSLSSWFMGVLRANAASEKPYLLEISIADQDYSIDWMKTGSALAAISIHKKPVHHVLGVQF
jgi:LysR family transcriptional regulator (chromosome initiation inhibitor)